jgi:hypothetical protein
MDIFRYEIHHRKRQKPDRIFLEQAIAQDNEVRLNDLVVASIKLADFGFDR